MKRIHLFALMSLAAMFFVACETSNPSIPEAFPKKNLIEEFTGQGCGYCPYGMDCVHEFMANDTNWVLILHHYGYAPDNFSVSGSKTITSALGVSGAPSVAINRAKTKYSAGNAIVFHPGYFSTVSKGQFETTTYASIVLNNTYDEETRELNVHVSGQIATKDFPELSLTVLIKESGMIDAQADYYDTYEGWQEFRHANAVRVFLSAPKGDDVHISKQQYQADYSVQLDKAWNPDNCMVVAFLSEAFKPVVQAEQKPVVAGTKGGEDILHGGVTPVPVADYYPEPNATNGPKELSGHEVDTISYTLGAYETYNDYGFNFWTVYGYNSEEQFMVNKTKCIPFVYLYLFTQTSETSIPNGVYSLDQTMKPGTAWGGYRDDEKRSIGGCAFYYISYAYFKQNSLVPQAQWLIADGTLTITDEGWELIGHARNGADIHLIGSTPILNRGKNEMPQWYHDSGQPSPNKLPFIR